MKKIDATIDELWDYLQVGPKDTYARIASVVREQIKQLDFTSTERKNAIDAYEKAVMGCELMPSEEKLLRRAVRLITKRE